MTDGEQQWILATVVGQLCQWSLIPFIPFQLCPWKEDFKFYPLFSPFLFPVSDKYEYIHFERKCKYIFVWFVFFAFVSFINVLYCQKSDRVGQRNGGMLRSIKTAVISTQCPKKVFTKMLRSIKPEVMLTHLPFVCQVLKTQPKC